MSVTDDQLLELLTLDHVVDENGMIEYRLDGELHRMFGPAVITAGGSELWYQHDKLHRDGGRPAITYPDGSEEWYQHGKFIRRIKKLRQ